MTIALIDTSIFCELLPVPHMAADHRGHLQMLKEKFDEAEVLLLPMATLYETGNHIGQNGNGHARRVAAQRFVEQVTLALGGDSPFTPLRFPDGADLEKWLADFPNWAQQGSGLGDLSIVKEWEHQCALFPARRVYIWSKDRTRSPHRGS